LSGAARSSESRAVRRVVAVGGGPVAWIAALALNRAFRHLKLEVTVLDTGADPESPVGYWTLPSQRGIHDMIGLRESELVKRTGASFKFASEYVQWSGSASQFVHAHAEIGTDIEGMPFYKYLQLAAMAGRAEKPADFSVSAIAAGLARFARPKDGSALTSNFTYAFHLEAVPYTALLRELAQAQGVRRIEGTVAQVSRTGNGNVDALQLANGERVEGDLFLDCSGPRASLMNLIGATLREDWSKWLPCDRQWSAFARREDNPLTLTRITASDAGWVSWSPLAQSSMMSHVYSSAHLGDEQALNRLRESARDMRGERLSRFSAGKRLRPWTNNCIALGDSAIELEPLAGAQLHAGLIGIGTLIDLFPLDTGSVVESVEYNRIMGEHADALRDFTMAVYRVNHHAGAFWDATRAEPAPARLAHKLDLYRANGRIVLLDFESFEEVDWAWLLLGSGFLPVTLEAQIQRLVEKVNPAELAPLQRRIVDLARSMPPHAQSIRPHG
jgi:tryptophan 7-halogenase